jgi:hypothetical protein
MDFNFKLTPNNQAITRVMDALSITRTRQIGLSAYIISKYNLRQYKRASLYWDEGNRVIAIIFSTEAIEEAYPLEFSERYGGGVKCGKFFSSNGLDVGELAGRYDYKVLPAIELGIPKAGDAFILRLDAKKTTESR